MAKILIIDDDYMMCEVLAALVNKSGHEAHCVFTLGEGLTAAFSGDYDIILLDVRLPDGNGLESLAKLRSNKSNPEVIIITGEGGTRGASLAINNGAWDYIEKPPANEVVSLSLLRALEFREAKQARKPIMALKKTGIVGNSPLILKCLDEIAQMAACDAGVLITGETGTGKELFAKAIHDNSSRGNKNFVVVDCAALPGNLVESTLFGYEKGAFTGADKSYSGLIKQADGGTLFLDEVGELPLSIQKVFLRVLQEHRFRPLRSEKEVHSDFRLIAATNRDLNQMVDQGLFRQDLLFRLQACVIGLPPLKDRKQDIFELTQYHITNLCRQYGTEIKGFSTDFFETLLSYDWPGNVRELFHLSEGAFLAGRHDPVLFQNHFPLNFRIQRLQDDAESKTLKREISPEPEPPAKVLPTWQTFREEAIKRAEKDYLLELLPTTNGDMAQACQVAGLARARLYELLKKHFLSLKG
jgi:two-component system, NtrC family, response regulator